MDIKDDRNTGPIAVAIMAVGGIVLDQLLMRGHSAPPIRGSAGAPNRPEKFSRNPLRYWGKTGLFFDFAFITPTISTVKHKIPLGFGAQSSGL